MRTVLYAQFISAIMFLWLMTDVCSSVMFREWTIPVVSLSDIVKWPPYWCVLRQQRPITASASRTGLANQNPLSQCVPGGLILTHLSLGISSNTRHSNPNSSESAKIPFSWNTLLVFAGPLRSPTTIFLGSWAFRSSTTVLMVSMWVDPGVGSAVLKLGLMSTFFPLTRGMPNASTTFLVALVRSGSNATTTLAVAMSRTPIVQPID